jgi:phosphatidate cytidylyltransferase
MKLRIISGLGMALVALAATWTGGVVFTLLWSCAASLFLAEFLAMIGYRPLSAATALGAVGMVAAAFGFERGYEVASLGALCLTALAVFARGEGGKARLLGAVGIAYAACVMLPVIHLRAEPGRGLALTLLLYAVVWGTDIGAYFVGRTLGGPKLWVRVSPNKTWSGFVGGTLIAIAAAFLAAVMLPSLRLDPAFLFAVALCGSVATHAGDLLESALKRRFSIKDSSQLIPGHGGFMDRLDGFALASLVVAVLVAAAG